MSGLGLAISMLLFADAALSAQNVEPARALVSNWVGTLQSEVAELTPSPGSAGVVHSIAAIGQFSLTAFGNGTIRGKGSVNGTMNIAIAPDPKSGYLGGSCTPPRPNWSDSLAVFGFQNASGTFLGFVDANPSRHTEIIVQCTQNTNESNSFRVNVITQPDYEGPSLVFTGPGTRDVFRVSLVNGSTMTFMNNPELYSGYLRIGITARGSTTNMTTKASISRQLENGGASSGGTDIPLFLIAGLILMALVYGSVKVYHTMNHQKQGASSQPAFAN